MAEFLFLLYWVLKCFYTGESGTLQPADYIFVLSFVCYIFRVLTKPNGSVGLFKKQDNNFFIFLVFVIAINLIYSIIYLQVDFLKTILYFIFNALIIIEFRGIANNKKFLTVFLFATIFCIIFQLFVFLLEFGEYWGNSNRYAGTFNDPNQFAFFIVSRFFICFVIFNHLRPNAFFAKLGIIILFFVTSYLVLQSSSTGMFLSLAVFVVIWLFVYMFTQKISVAWIIGVFIIVAFALFLLLGGDKLLNFDLWDNSFLSERLAAKLSQTTGNSGLSGYIEDRCLGPFFKKTYYILFGAGEGYNIRFIDVGSKGGEMHATVLSLLFYYGIIPYIILWKWVLGNFKGIKKIDMCAYIALFIEMFTLANHRQASLWILLMLPSVLSSCVEGGKDAKV